MMLFRSIFWLSVAYVVMLPHTDFDATADAVTNKVVSASQQFASEQISNTACSDLRCEAGKVIVSAVLTSHPSSEATMQASDPTVPIPRPRPHWKG